MRGLPRQACEAGHLCGACRQHSSGRGQAGCPSQGRAWHLCWGPFAQASLTTFSYRELYFFLCSAKPFSPYLFSVSFSIFGVVSPSPKFLQGSFFTFLFYFLPVVLLPTPSQLWSCPFLSPAEEMFLLCSPFHSPMRHLRKAKILEAEE